MVKPMAELLFDKAKWLQDSDGFWLLLRVKTPAAAKDFVSSMKEKLYSVSMKEYRQKRSLNANAYAWVLMDKIAQVLRTDKDEVYLEMLSRYGVFTHLIVKPSVVEKVKQEWRTVKELGEVTVNGQTGIQLQCYFGSSIYDTKEMARLIDGIVSEAKDLEIETMTPPEIERLKDGWNK
jgi:hypothetical protein